MFLAPLNIYETDKLLAEYLLFHYGTAEEILPYGFGPQNALAYPVRCVTECLDLARLTADAHGLDLGCAVGRSTFELARYCAATIGIDSSRMFTETARVLQRTGEFPYQRIDEGELCTPLIARVPADINRQRVVFETGDAMNLRRDLPPFDVVLMANLVDRLRDPGQCLERLPALVKSRGQLIITSPYTWLEDFTPQANWVGGCVREGRAVTTAEGLEARLGQSFSLVLCKDLPFLIREHARKFQWSVAQATVWIRR